MQTRGFSDSDVARLLAITPAAVLKMRKERGLLPKRAPIAPGSTGGKHTARYSFLDVVGAEVARRSAKQFGWPPRDLRRVIQLIQSGDRAQLERARIVTLRTERPGALATAFFSPEELDGEYGRKLDLARERGEVVDETPLVKVVEFVANELHERMKAIGYEFSDGTGRITRGGGH